MAVARPGEVKCVNCGAPIWWSERDREWQHDDGEAECGAYEEMHPAIAAALPSDPFEGLSS